MTHQPTPTFSEASLRLVVTAVRREGGEEDGFVVRGECALVLLGTEKSVASVPGVLGLLKTLALELARRRRVLARHGAPRENVGLEQVELDGLQHDAHPPVADVPFFRVVGARGSAVEFDEVLAHSDEVHCETS